MNNTYYNMNNKRCIRENGGHGSNPIIVRKLRAMRTIDELLRTPSPEIAERAKEAVEDLANTAFELAYPRTNESRNRSVIRLTESDLHKIVKRSVNKILKESLGPNIRIDDKNRVFEAFKNLIHAMIWENEYIGGDENKLNDAENKYLQEHGERDIEMLWNNVQKYVVPILDSEFEGDDLGQDDFDEEGNYKWDE